MSDTKNSGADVLEVGISAPVISLDNVHVAWDSHLVLHGIEFDVLPGQTVALTGANGSGKSTTLHAILGTAPITRGSIHLFGVDNTHRRAVNWDRIGYVPQRISVGGAVTSSALEVVKSGLLGSKKWWSLPGDTKKAMAALKRVGLAHRAKDSMSILSGGQQQRVLIARALVRNPDLLIMDEPMAGIDRASRERLARIVSEAKAEGTTILVVLHELGELGPLLDRELHIGGGHVTYDGPPHISDDHEQHSDGGGHHHGHPHPQAGSGLVDDIWQA